MERIYIDIDIILILTIHFDQFTFLIDREPGLQSRI